MSDPDSRGLRPSEMKLSMGLLLLVVTAFLIQNYVIFPVESRIFDPSVVQIASLIFIPHGVKVIVATLYGHLAVFPILAGQTLGVYMYTRDFEFSVSFGAIAVLAIYIPVYLVSYLESGGFEKDVDQLTAKSTLLLGRKVLVIALISSLLNSYFASLLNDVTPESQIWLRFLMGDMLGAAAVFLLVYLLRNIIRNRLFRKTGVESSEKM